MSRLRTTAAMSTSVICELHVNDPGRRLWYNSWASTAVSTFNLSSCRHSANRTSARLTLVLFNCQASVDEPIRVIAPRARGLPGRDPFDDHHEI